MYNVIIVDDEPKLLEVLKIKLQLLCPDLNIVAATQSAGEAYVEIRKHLPDIVFLDIAMPIENGFDLIQKFDKIDFEIIFITGYNEYALDALKVSAVDYVLKPIDDNDLLHSVEKAKKRIENKHNLDNYMLLKENVNHIGSQESKIVISGVSTYEFVQVSEIIRCQAWGKYTKVFLSDGNILTSTQNLNIFVDLLKRFDFFSPHRSHLINKRYLIRYLKNDCLLVLNDETKIPLSKRRKTEFINSALYTSMSKN